MVGRGRGQAVASYSGGCIHHPYKGQWGSPHCHFFCHLGNLELISCTLRVAQPKAAGGGNGTCILLLDPVTAHPGRSARLLSGQQPLLLSLLGDTVSLDPTLSSPAPSGGACTLGLTLGHMREKFTVMGVRPGVTKSASMVLWLTLWGVCVPGPGP